MIKLSELKSVHKAMPDGKSAVLRRKPMPQISLLFVKEYIFVKMVYL
jgi:hypothetical protein